MKSGLVSGQYSISMSLRGKLGVFDDQNRLITPKGAKERALVVLLAMSPNGKRSRKWLQNYKFRRGTTYKKGT